MKYNFMTPFILQKNKNIPISKITDSELSIIGIGPQEASVPKSVGNATKGARTIEISSTVACTNIQYAYRQNNYNNGPNKHNSFLILPLLVETMWDGTNYSMNFENLTYITSTQIIDALDNDIPIITYIIFKPSEDYDSIYYFDCILLNLNRLILKSNSYIIFNIGEIHLQINSDGTVVEQNTEPE